MLKWLLGGSDTASKMVDAGISVGDKLFYTAEEKADDKQRLVKSKTEIFKLWIDYQRATSGQNLTRRVLAIVAAGMWVSTGLLYVGLVLFEPGQAQTVAGITTTTAGPKAQAVYAFFANDVTPAFMLVMTFYYVKGALDNYTASKRDQMPA